MEIFINFYDEVTEESTNKVLEELNGILDYNRYLMATYRNPKDLIEVVKVRIKTIGGSVEDGFAIYDTLKLLQEEGVTVVTEIQGKCMSMGVILFLAGQYRLMGKNAILMIHELSDWSGWETLSRKENSVAYGQKLQKRLNRIILDTTKITEEMLETHRREDWYLDFEECEELGITNIPTEEELIDDLLEGTIIIDKDNDIKKQIEEAIKNENTKVELTIEEPTSIEKEE